MRFSRQICKSGALVEKKREQIWHSSLTLDKSCAVRGTGNCMLWWAWCEMGQIWEHLWGFVVFLTFLWWEGKCLHNTDSPHLHLSKIPRRPNTLFVLVHVCQFECSCEGEQFRWGEGDREEGQRVSVANLSAAACDPCGHFFYLVHWCLYRHLPQQSTCLHLQTVSNRTNM